MKKNDFLLIGGFTVLMVAVNVILVMTGQITWTGGVDWDVLATMIGAAITIAIMSQLYKDNPLFKLAEHMFVGLALGYGLIVLWNSMWINEILPGFEPLGKYGFKALTQPSIAGGPQLLGVWSIILPAILGLMMYTRLSKKYAWISRIPFAIMIGFGVGMAIPNEIQANLLRQLQPMMIPLFKDPNTGAFTLDVLIIFIGVMATLVYFFFSIEHKGAVGAVSRVGVWFLMIAFGASFGYTVQGRLSLLIGRINFLFRDWLPLIQ